MIGRKQRGTRVGSSDLKGMREELLKAHEEFQKLLDSGYEITVAKKVKRPRIKRTPQPKYVVTLVFGRELKMTIEEYNTRGQGFKKVREIY
jgi:hypothetical protein